MLLDYLPVDKEISRGGSMAKDGILPWISVVSERHRVAKKPAGEHSEEHSSAGIYL